MKIFTLSKIALVSTALIYPFLCGQEVVGKFHQEYKSGSKPTIELTNRSGDIHITGTEDNLITVTGKVIKKPAHLFSGVDQKVIDELLKNPPLNFNNSTLTIDKIDRDLGHYVRIEYTISTPNGTSLEISTGSGDIDVKGIQPALDISTGSGDILLNELKNGGTVSTGSGDVSGQSTFGKLLISTGSGDIKFADCGGEFVVSTGSGDIRVAFSNDGKVDASTGSGDIDLYHLIGIAHAVTASGDVSISGYPTDEWSLTSTSGDMEVDLADEAGVNLDARTVSGDISVKLPSETVDSGKHWLKAVINHGGPDIKLRTTSGDVDLF